MKIHLRQIPSEGTRLEGEENCAFPELESEGIQCAGPLRYALDVGLTGVDLWANGSLAQPVDLTCVSCLDRFVHTIEVPQFATLVEAPGAELVDLTPAAREDILLNLPAHPRCDIHGGRECRAARAPAAEPGQVEQASAEKREHDWGALDKLRLKKK